MPKVDFEKITIEFRCTECGDTSTTTLENILQVGNPYCGECDCEYDVACDNATVKLV